MVSLQSQHWERRKHKPEAESELQTGGLPWPIPLKFTKHCWHGGTSSAPSCGLHVGLRLQTAQTWSCSAAWPADLSQAAACQQCTIKPAGCRACML